MKPNYEIRPKFSKDSWKKVYADSKTGEVFLPDGMKYNFRLSQFESSHYWDIRPLEPPKDNVNSPTHYGQGKIECIDYIKDFLTTEEYIGYLRGNIAKYLHRWRYKNGLEDLEKAQWYLEELIKTKKDLGD